MRKRFLRYLTPLVAGAGLAVGPLFPVAPAQVPAVVRPQPAEPDHDAEEGVARISDLPQPAGTCRISDRVTAATHDAGATRISDDNADGPYISAVGPAAPPGQAMHHLPPPSPPAEEALPAEPERASEAAPAPEPVASPPVEEAASGVDGRPVVVEPADDQAAVPVMPTEAPPEPVVTAPTGPLPEDDIDAPFMQPATVVAQPAAEEPLPPAAEEPLPPADEVPMQPAERVEEPAVVKAPADPAPAVAPDASDETPASPPPSAPTAAPVHAGVPVAGDDCCCYYGDGCCPVPYCCQLGRWCLPCRPLFGGCRGCGPLHNPCGCLAGCCGCGCPCDPCCGGRADGPCDCRVPPWWKQQLLKYQARMATCGMHDDDCPPLPKEWHPPCGRLWGSAEWLLWWFEKAPLPVPLVTTGTTESLGILNERGTRIVFGGSGLGYDSLPNGLRLTTGYWFDRCNCIGLEGSVFALEQATAEFMTGSDATGNPVLARPVRNAVTGFQTVLLVSRPGSFAGFVDVDASCRLWGGDVNLRTALYRNRCCYLDLLYGIRYLDLDEDLSITQASQNLAGGTTFFLGNPVPGTNITDITDSFATRNQFLGGQLGARFQYHYCRFFVDLLAKVAIGSTRQQVTITGDTTILSPDGQLRGQALGGLLALASNIGRYQEKDAFTVVPEIGINLGYQVTDRARLMVGYNFLFWSEVARPGDQINTLVNPTLVPVSSVYGPLFGPAQPQGFFNTREFYAHGFTFGLAFNY